MHYHYKYRKHMALTSLKGTKKMLLLNKEKAINKENNSLFRN